MSDGLSLGSNVDVKYTDFTKALGIINHNILSLKLSEVGVCRSLISSIMFSSRTLFIVYK